MGLDEPSSAYARKMDNMKWMQKDLERRAAEEVERERAAKEAERQRRLRAEDEERTRQEEEHQNTIKSDASHMSDDAGDEIFSDNLDWKRYFAKYGARDDFFQIYSSVAKNASKSIEAPPPSSPRTKFVRLLQSQDSIPWPAILRKMEAPREISLEGLGLGDIVIPGIFLALM